MDINDARDVHDVDRAARKITANENFMAADDKGNIGFWHPGLFPLRPRGWDERLPYPGTGEAEWQGFLKPSRIPAVINPHQGWLANWNNLPAVGWTAGDGTARKRMDGQFFRVGWLMRLVREFAKAPSLPAMEGLIHRSGTVAQQFPQATARLRKARKHASGDARKVLDTLLAWDGSYDRTGPDGKVDPGVATWQAFLAQAEKLALEPFGDAAKYLAPDDAQAPLYGGYHHGTPYHYFDAPHGQSFALRTLKPAQLREAAANAFPTLGVRFNSADPKDWREPRRMYPIGAVGATSPPAIPFFDRGTYEQLLELGP
jgi:acyl-homoserine lactone acylase PvdQ